MLQRQQQAQPARMAGAPKPMLVRGLASHRVMAHGAMPCAHAAPLARMPLGRQAGQRLTSARAIDKFQPLASMSELMDEAGTNPLAMALERAQMILGEKAALREALEAEAQEVAQLAVEAGEAKTKAKEAVFEVIAMIEDATRLQQRYATAVEPLRAALAKAQEAGDQPAPGGDSLGALEEELAAAEEKVEEVSRQVTALRTKLEELYAKAVAAETASAKAETIASAAMKAAEQAVKDEMQAAAVVKETQTALEKTQTLQEPLASEAPVATGAKDAAIAAAATAAAAPLPPAPPSDSKPKPPSRLPQLIGAALVAAVGWWALNNTAAGQAVAAAASNVIAIVMEKVSHIHVHEGEKGVVEAIVLLLSSIVCVPLVVKCIPGGNPVLGYLLGGAIVGPHALGLIQDVQSVKHLAELGVVFLLFNIGLELSLERLQSMAKYVFGMGTAQVALSLVAVAAAAVALTGLSGPSAIILGGSLAMSSTAVAIQVLEDRGEMGSRHGRATFSVLLLQDLAVVVLLMLIPLLAPAPDGSSGGMAKIAKALGLAAVKAVVCIVGIIAGGRLFIQPLYKKMSSFANAEIFAATTLAVVLSTSVLTSLAGLSLALGAFLAGLLIAETEYALQVESDIAPYKGLLLGLFFMSVGMEMNAKLFLEKWQTVLAAIVVLIVGKVGVMLAAGPMFGLSKIASTRAGLLLAPGGEFAFVAFGESVARGVLPAALTNQLYLVVALSMALTPYLAAFGAKLGSMLEKNDVKALQPQEEETKELRDHVIIAGYGRAGQLIGQLLSEKLIPFVALDVSNERVAAGKGQDLPVYFGDAGSPAVLHLVGAERAACAIIALDSPGANYRAVWAMAKHYPHVKTYVRAHDLAHGINLEKAGATAVVPEVLEPSLQLGAAVLRQLEFSPDEVTATVDDFRRKHLAELQALSANSGTSLGYGFSPAASASSSGAGSSSTGSTEGGAGGMVVAGAAA